MNLPKLKGTPKQVAWAERIRKYFMDRLENFTDDPENIEDYNLLYDTNLTKEDIEKIIDYIAKQDQATYYIDNRDLNVYKLLRAEMENALKEEEAEKEEAEKEEEIAVEAKEELTVRPEKEIKEMRRKIKEKILRKAEEVTGVAPKRWEGQNGIVRYYFNYGSKTIYFSFKEDGRVEAGANRPGATTEIFRTLESLGFSVAEQKGNWTIWKK